MKPLDSKIHRLQKKYRYWDDDIATMIVDPIQGDNTHHSAMV